MNSIAVGEVAGFWLSVGLGLVGVIIGVLIGAILNWWVDERHSHTWRF